jgi:hypothetical protein
MVQDMNFLKLMCTKPSACSQTQFVSFSSLVVDCLDPKQDEVAEFLQTMNRVLADILPLVSALHFLKKEMKGVPPLLLKQCLSPGALST